MGPTITLGDIVCVAEHTFLIRIVPLHCHFDNDIVAFSCEIKHSIVKLRLVFVEVFNERTNPAFVFEYHIAFAGFFNQADSNAGVQKRQLTEPFGEDIVVERDVGKDFWTRMEMNRRPGGIGLAKR